MPTIEGRFSEPEFKGDDWQSNPMPYFIFNVFIKQTAFNRFLFNVLISTNNNENIGNACTEPQNECRYLLTSRFIEFRCSVLPTRAAIDRTNIAQLRENSLVFSFRCYRDRRFHVHGAFVNRRKRTLEEAPITLSSMQEVT